MKNLSGMLLVLTMVGAAGCSQASEPAPAAQPATAPAPAPAAPAQPASTAANPAAVDQVEKPNPVATSPAPSTPPAAAGGAGATPAASPNPAAAAPASNSAPSASAPAALTPSDPPAAAPEPPPPPPPPPLRTVTLSTGRPIAVYTTTELSTKTAKTGEAFTATLAEPIVDGDWVVARKGARVHGVVVDSDEGARVKGLASIAVTLKTLTLADGRIVDLSASQVRREAKNTKKKDATKIGVATGIGAAIGAIAGGGKGAAIGAGVGAGAGTGTVLATRGDPAVIPAETQLRFTLRSPVKITEQRASER